MLTLQLRLTSCRVCRKALKHYESHDVQRDHVFTVPVSTAHVHSHVERYLVQLPHKYSKYNNTSCYIFITGMDE